MLLSGLSNITANIKNNFRTQITGTERKDINQPLTAVCRHLGISL